MGLCLCWNLQLALVQPPGLESKWQSCELPPALEPEDTLVLREACCCTWKGCWKGDCWKGDCWGEGCCWKGRGLRCR